MIGVRDGRHFLMVAGESIDDVLARDQGFSVKAGS